MGLPSRLVTGILLALFTDTALWIPIQLGFYAMEARELIRFLLQEKINTVSKGIDRISITITISLWIVLLFSCIVQSVSNPAISLVIIVLFILRWRDLLKFSRKKELSS